MVRLLERLNTPQAVVVTLAIFLVVVGFSLYHRQQQFEGHNVAEMTIDANPAAAEETVAAREQEPTASEGGAATAAQQDLTAAEESAVFEEELAAPPTREADVVRVAVRVTDAASWLRVQEDREIVLEQVSEPGFYREFAADQAISIWADNAGAVQIEVDGQDLGPLGASGEATTRTYTTQREEEASV